MKIYRQIEEERNQLISLKDSIENAFNGKKGFFSKDQFELLNQINLQTDLAIFDKLKYKTSDQRVFNFVASLFILVFFSIIIILEQFQTWKWLSC